MKISPKSIDYKLQHEKEASSASKFLAFLIKYCLLPITVTKDKIEFSLLSRKTMILAGTISVFNMIYFLLTFVIITPITIDQLLGNNAVGES